MPNCRPGDLAVIIRTAGYEWEKENLGRIVEVLELYETLESGEPLWIIATPSGPLFIKDKEVSHNIAARDSCLQPIRPPSKEQINEQTKEYSRPTVQV